MDKSGGQRLNECYRLLDRSGDLEGCLARYPDLADEIRGYAVVRQFVVDRVPDGPDPRALIAGRSLLLAAAGAQAGPQLLPRFSRLHLAGAAASLVLLAGAVVGAGAATGGGWLPGPVTRVLSELGIIHPGATIPSPSPEAVGGSPGRGASPTPTVSPAPTPSPTQPAASGIAAAQKTPVPGQAPAAAATATAGPHGVAPSGETVVPGNGESGAITPTATPTIVPDSADLQVTKLCQPDTNPPAGQPISCSVFVDNHGPSDAQAVVVEDTTHAGGSLQVTGIAATQGTCDAATTPVTGGQKFVCNLGSLAAASTSTSGRAVVTYQLLSSEGQDIDNVAAVRSDTPDPDDSNNTATVNLAITAVADLALVKSGPASVAAGTPITWTIDVTNAGPSTAASVLIADTVPAGVTITSVTAPGGSCVPGAAGDPLNPTTCSFGSLAPSAPALTLTIQASVNSGTTGVLHNEARVSSAALDPNNDNNLGSADTAVEVIAEPTADLAVTLSADSATYKPSSTVRFRLTVVNSGPSDAVGVVATVQLPPAKTGHYVADSGACTLSNTTLTCQLGTMAAGAPPIEIFIDYFVQGNKGTVTITASVASLTEDPVSANDGAAVSVAFKDGN